jgi:hypothetical protein
MAAPYQLRPYRPEDEDAAIALWRSTWQEAYPHIDFAARVTWWRERWRNELVANAAIVVAEQAGELMGFVTIDATGYLDPGALAFIFRVQRWTIRRRDTRRRKLSWTRDSVSGRYHSGQAGRNRGALRQRLRTHVGAGGERIIHAVGHVVAFAGSEDRRCRCGREFCRTQHNAWRVPVQRGRACIAR